MNNSREKRGLTLVELLAVIAIIGLLIALLLPAVQSARESARRSSCSSNLRQVSQGVLGFEAAFGKFPALLYEWNLRDMLANAGLSTTDSGTGSGPGISKTWSAVGPLFHILPYMDELAVYDRSLNRWLTSTLSTDISLRVDEAQPRAFLCPSDPVRAPWRPVHNDFIGLTSYHVCQGDGFEGGGGLNPREVRRGVFRYGAVLTGTNLGPRSTTMAHVLDGISNTVMLGEVAIFDGTNRFPGGIGNRTTDLLAGNSFTNSGAETPAVCLALVNGDGRYTAFESGMTSGVPGWRWNSGAERAVAFSTISAPNTPRCGRAGGSRLVPASSHHISGAFVSMCDGSIRWVGDDIDDSYPAGLNYSIYHKGPSHFGVWGALGTMAGGELMDADRYR